MSDAKFLGLCIVFAAILISATIVWSASVTQAALAGQAPKDVTVPAASPSNPAITTVRLEGPVTLAPITTPIPVSVTNSDENPVVVKDVPEKTWHR